MLNVPMALLLQLVKNVPGSVDENGLCHCVVHLPNNLAPLKQLEQLQAITQELMHKYEQELSRVSAGAAGWGSWIQHEMSQGGKEIAEGGIALFFGMNPEDEGRIRYRSGNLSGSHSTGRLVYDMLPPLTGQFMGTGAAGDGQRL